MMQRHVLDDLKKTAEEKPDKIAFSDGEKGLSFAEVDAVRDSIGSYLHAQGIYNKPVVVFMQKSPEEVAVFFGVITGGCYYVPIDEEMP
ncbi:MAG: AMP-binding protein, partial [Lachnospiraceae bacterium]|nr:AMP-binding protein [Lachnospiraceae bacterium]